MCSETLIGNDQIRGVSGGQRKRVTTGELLVSPKKTLFLDEISTGLDSATTFQIVRTLGHFAHLRQATMLIALLQPTPEVYHLFDDIMLLSEGTSNLRLSCSAMLNGQAWPSSSICLCNFVLAAWEYGLFCLTNTAQQMEQLPGRHPGVLSSQCCIVCFDTVLCYKLSIVLQTIYCIVQFDSFAVPFVMTYCLILVVSMMTMTMQQTGCHVHVSRQSGVSRAKGGSGALLPEHALLCAGAQGSL